MPEAQFSFHVHHTQGKARAGEFITPHGKVRTPVFMPVATQASVKSLTPEEVIALSAEMVLCNAYHMYLRPGIDHVRKLGGLHSFMGWPGPVLTDSGGFQVFSMGELRQVHDDGVWFRSHLDGSKHWLSPALATANQEGLGADIIMCLDQCIGYGAHKAVVRQAMERTHRWAHACYQAHVASENASKQALFGIVQGGVFQDLRDESAELISTLPFAGYAIGGLAVGESKELMYEITGRVTEKLPQALPRYLMGVGSPEDLVEGVALGVDMFDCALPTRVARNGALFTRHGRVNIDNRRFSEISGPLEEDCDCYACCNFSAAYLWHLFRAKELLGLRLATIHNLRFVLRLMADMREAIVQDRFDRFRQQFLDTYHPTDEGVRQEQKARWLRRRNG
jgi:queuine tRNA-ribosyltransferase